MLTVFSWIALAVGLFYAAGAIFLLRSLAVGDVVDQALAALGGDDAGNERRRTRLLTAGACLTFASGLSLVALSRWTPALFALNAVFQSGYLVWATRKLPPEDETERSGRRSTVRAFFVYLVALGFVVAAGGLGIWRIWLDPAWLELLAIAGATLAVALLVRFPFSAGSSDHAPVVDRTPEPAVPETESSEHPPSESHRPDRLRLMPEYNCGPIWDGDDSRQIDPSSLDLSAALQDRIRAWDEVFQATFREDDPFESRFTDADVERAWTREGRFVALALGDEWDGELVVLISGLDAMLRSAARDLAPGQSIPLERAADVGAQCGIAEIEEVIERLDSLAREKDALPEWDGDSQDDVGRAQELLARILASVPDRYDDDVRRALESPEPQTRQWVELALERRRAARQQTPDVDGR